MILALIAAGSYPVTDSDRDVTVPRAHSRPGCSDAPAGCSAKHSRRTGCPGIPDCQRDGFRRRVDLAMRHPKLGILLFDPETRVCAAKMELILRYARRPGASCPVLCSTHFGACTRV